MKIKNFEFFDYNIENTEGSGASNCRFNTDYMDQAIKDRIQSCFQAYGPAYVILGDSHAIDLFGMVASTFKVDFLIGLTRGYCRPHTPKEFCQYEEFLSFATENSHLFQHIIYTQAGFYLLKTTGGQKGSRRLFERVPLSQLIANIVPDEDHIYATYRYLKALSEAVPVTWFGPRIEPHITTQMIFRLGCDYPYQLRNGQEALYRSLDAKIEELASGEARLKFISQIETLDFAFPNDFMNCGVRYWSDGDHFSAIGEEYFGRRLPDDFLDFE